MWLTIPKSSSSWGSGVPGREGAMHMRMRKLFLFVVAGVAILSGIVTRQPAPTQAAGGPTGLPAHFALGVSAAPDSSGLYGWMPNSGIPWDYAYQYLSGGANTSSDWKGWNASGQFPLYYAQGASSHHYIPVFTFYNLLQSNGSCNSCGEAQRDLSNLNNPATMASYFADFRLLMQRLGSGTYGGITGFGGTAIVHVEPDLSGYAQQAVLNTAVHCFGYCFAQGNDPANLSAAVATTNDPDLQGLPNTYQGFSWALLHLRDLYAPNVRLAFHVSDWSTENDVGTITSAALDPAALGQEAGSFAARSGVNDAPNGISTYDLLFNDPSDRDAAYYKYVLNQPNAFWDSANVTFPNFHRWESYVAAAAGVVNRPVIIWQIPEGNQYFSTENNTYGHYQDNRVAYFMSHIQELAGTGIIGLLFGAGNAGSTSHTDASGDGITTPTATCTSDGVSSGQVCASHISTVSDDDGGYLRLEAQQYYLQGAYDLSGTPGPTASVTATPGITSTPTGVATAVAVTGSGTSPSSIAPTGTVALTASVTSATAISNCLVDFEVYDTGGAKIYQTSISSLSLSAGTPKTVQATWQVPSTQAPGTYTLKVGVFGGGWAPMYAWDDAAGSVGVAPVAPGPTGSALAHVVATSIGTDTLVSWKSALHARFIGFRVRAPRSGFQSATIARHTSRSYRVKVAGVLRGPIFIDVLFSDGRRVAYRCHRL
jgi:hypothetical protein